MILVYAVTLLLKDNNEMFLKIYSVNNIPNSRHNIVTDQENVWIHRSLLSSLLNRQLTCMMVKTHGAKTGKSRGTIKYR